MKIKELIKNLEKLDQNKNIFIRNFMMCDKFEIETINSYDITVWNKWINGNNIWDYYIKENNEWLDKNAAQNN